MSSIVRFKNGYINIAATIRQTAKMLKYDEVSASDIAHELACQGLNVVDTDNEIGQDANMHRISLPQIRRALSNNFYHCGKGYYAVSLQYALTAWWKKYHKDGCTCDLAPVPGVPIMISGVDDCPIHGLGHS